MQDLSEDSFYCYPGTDVLINLQGERDPEKLASVERLFSGARLADLYRKPCPGRFDLKHLQKIHHYLFQDIYPWAGQLRRVDISKGFLFCHVAYIEHEANKLFAWLKEQKFFRGLGFDELMDKASHLFSEINALHPFRDGNGRTQREFLRELLLRTGYEVRYSMLKDPSLMIRASVAACNGDESLMRQLFCACTVKRGTRVPQNS